MSFDTRLVNGISVMAAILDAGSFSRAAETLGMTPSGVSRAVTRLEARVGVRLFDRTPRSVRLTEEGQRFYNRVVPLLSSIEEVAAEIGDSTAVATGRLRINVDPWFARTVLAAHLPRFMERNPGVSVEMIVSNHREDMMVGCDVAIRFGPAQDSSLIGRKLLETRVLTCAAPAYLEKHGVPKVPQDLERHEIMLFRDPQTGQPFPWELTRKGKVLEVRAHGRFTTDDPSAALSACVAGQGIFQSLELGLEPWLTSGRVVQVLSDWAEERYPLYVYYHSRQHLSAKIKAFLDFVGSLAHAAPAAS